MKKIIGLFVTLLILLLATAGWFVGDHFVDFAFKRGDKATMEPPMASIHIITKGLNPENKPNFPNENWVISMNNGEKRNATAFYSTDDCHDWVIMVHGYCRHQGYVWNYAEEYLNRNYNVLTPDLNASGTSDGEYLTMGVYESDDIVRWAEEIVKHDNQARIVLHGVSMGAATVMLATAKNLPPNVIACVEDCGYTSAYDMFSVQMEKVLDLPSFPILNCVDIVNKIKVGCYLSDATPLNAVQQTKIPTLFIHGDADKLVPIEMEHQLYAASAAPFKEEIVVPEAAHAAAVWADTDKYFDDIMSFLQKIEK